MTAPADPGAWRAAERAEWRGLADLAAALARLDERLARSGGEAALARLAREEAAALVRAAGGRLPTDAFLLWRHGHPAHGAEPEALRLADWAARRLAWPGPAGPDGHPQDAAALAALLGRSPGPVPPVAEASGELARLHPLAQGAAFWAAWRRAQPGAPVEGLVLAARLAAGAERQARFLPLGTLPLPARARDAGGAAAAALAAFLAAGRARTAAFLAGLARQAEWQDRARAAAPGLPGRLAARVLDLAGSEELVSANLVRDRIGASQQAGNRALRRLAGLGLIEEVSGQARFRLWRPRL